MMDFSQRIEAEDYAKELRTIAKYSDCWCNNRQSKSTITKLMNTCAEYIFKLSSEVSSLEDQVSKLEKLR